MKLRFVPLVLVACQPGVPGESTSLCVPELPDPERSRAKQVRCGDELVGGHAETGDWLLQSRLLTLYIRAERFALSKPGRAGGTLLDVIPENASVDLEELVPLLPQQDGTLDWFEDIDITPVEDDRGAGLRIDGVLPDGTEGTVLWWLDHGSDRLDIEGASDFDVVPLANAALRGDLMAYGDHLVGPGTVTEDSGGQFRWTETTWLRPATAASLPDVLPDRYTQPIAGACPNGELIYLRDADGRVAQREAIVTASGEFEFLGDNRATEIICLASSRDSSGWQPLPAWSEGEAPLEEVELRVGDLGQLSVHVSDSHGNPLPATVWWNDSQYYFGLGKGTMGVGAGEGSGVVGAGPAWSAAALAPLDVTEDSTARAVLHRVLPDDVLLASFFVEAWPHPTTRTSASSRVGRAIALGAEWAVTVGDHAVVATDVSQFERDEVWSSSGARAPTTSGTITSWPWSFNRRAQLWGAPDTTDLGPHEALAVMGGGRGLRTTVDTTWVDSAGPPHTWPVKPDALHLQSLDDLPVYIDLLDQFTALAVVGPLTWLDGVDRRTMASVEAERALEERRTMATTGPLVRLNTGSSGDLTTPLNPQAATIEVMAPTWMPVDHAALIGPGGERLAEWTLPEPLEATRLHATVDLPVDTDWVFAIAWSDRTNAPLQTVTPWTVTSAVFLPTP